MTAQKAAKHPYLAHKLIVGAIGVTLSIVLHEAFHVWMHWGEIVSVRFFQGLSIAEVIVMEHKDYDVDGEEVAAYLITILVIMLTVIAIYRIHDSTDARSVRQLLYPAERGNPGWKARELQKLAELVDLVPLKSSHVSGIPAAKLKK